MIAGVGIDIIEVERIRKVFQDRDEKFVRKIFTDAELSYCRQFSDPFPHLAARFSAKEALYKSIGFGVIHFGEIETLNEPSDKPYMVLYGETKKRWEGLGKPAILVSLSHTVTMGSATVILDRQ